MTITNTSTSLLTMTNTPFATHSINTKGKLGEPEGKILQSAFSKIAEDEYVKASANTGKEYFDAFDKHARDLKKQNKLDYDFKLLYPYTYLYLTEYAK